MLPGRRHTSDGFRLFLVESKNGDCERCCLGTTRMPAASGSMGVDHACGYVAELVLMTQIPIGKGDRTENDTRGAEPELRPMDQIPIGSGNMRTDG